MSFPKGEFIQQPVFKVIQEMEKFRLRIHCHVHELFACREELSELNEIKKSHQTLVKAGFPPTLDEEEMTELKQRIPSVEEAISVLSRHLDEYRKLGLGDYLDLEVRAMDLEVKIRRSWIESDYDFDLTDSDAHWEQVLDYLAEHLIRLQERDRILPAWDLLEYNRKAESTGKGKDSVLVDAHMPTEHFMHALLLRFMINVTNLKRMSYVCNKYSFYCRYLDDELRNMVMFAVQLSRNPDTRAWRDIAPFLFTADDAELCAKLNRLFDDDEPDYMLIGIVAFRMYRTCMDQRCFQLADEWMEVGMNMTSTTPEQLDDLLDGTRIGLQRSSLESEPRARVQLDGSHVGVSRHYRLPVLRHNRTAASSPKPWWLERLRTQPAIDFGMQHEKSTADAQQSWDSQATTVGPSETATRDSFWDKTPEERSSLLQQQNLEENRAAAAFYRDHSRASSVDMSIELPLCSIEIEMDQTECLYLKWKNSDGEDQERRTNLRIGKPYHCRTFSYDAVNDEWIGNDTFCKFNSQLDVKQEGGSRVPVLGDGGGIYPTELPSLFKMYRDKGDHRLDKYLADVRAQSVAAYYAERFRERTKDKFGCITMLAVELVLVFNTPRKGTIIDFATREISVNVDRENSAGSFGKFTNNWSWKNREMRLDIFEAFGHFTHADSDGVVMVTDLQGFAGIKGGGGVINCFLTDPVIHSQARDTQTFGRTNYGTEGMNEFFASVHKECNHICEFLKLKRPDDESSSSGGPSERT